MKFLFLLTLLFSFNSFAFENSQEAYKKAEKGEAILIDVREEDEVKDGMVKNAKWFPLSRLEQDPTKWKKDFENIVSGKEIFLYCRSGKRAERSLEILKKNNIPSKNLGGWITLKEELPTTGK